MSGFYEFAASFGILCDRLYPQDRIQRLPTANKPNKKNAAVFWDGRRGWVFIWGEVETVQWWNDPNAKPWTEKEKAEIRKRQDEARRERARMAAEAARTAKEILDGTIQDEHPYLNAKGLAGQKGMVSGNGALIVPMTDLSGRLKGLQYIQLVDNQWEKKYLPGQESKGAVFKNGRGTETILCEGYATGLSIKMALEKVRLDMSVLCCFSAYNLAHVASITEGRRYVFADNDASETGQRTAIKTGLPWVMSDTVGQDANDLHQSKGIMAVCKKVMELRRL